MDQGQWATSKALPAQTCEKPFSTYGEYFQNDALIALTARRHGATVVTANPKGFQLLADKLRLSVLLL